MQCNSFLFFLIKFYIDLFVEKVFFLEVFCFVGFFIFFVCVGGVWRGVFVFCVFEEEGEDVD